MEDFYRGNDVYIYEGVGLEVSGWNEEPQTCWNFTGSLNARR